MSTRHRALLPAALLSLAACAGAGNPPSGAVPVAAGTMLSILRSNTLDGVNESNATLRAHVAPGQEVHLSIALPGGRGWRDTGQVRADGDALCWRFDEVRDGNDACYHYCREGDRFWATPRGQGRPLTFRVAPGNPFGL